jgi:Domain of unknown function (DUF397)
VTPPSVHRPRSEPSGPGPRWRKSTLSLANGNCVEVAGGQPGGIGVRDSMDPGGPVLRFTPDEWRAFLGRMRKR